MSKFNPTNFNWTLERNCSCEEPLLFYWINLILRKIRRRRECKLIRKGATQFHEKARGAPTPNTPTAHRRGDPIPTVSEMTPLKIIAPTLGEMKKTHAQTSV
uniref:Uncharacterized protein n=1 Tax=Meloidogyne javanica TaxID=6303 RepID=A0A915MPA2_MELJA